MTALYRPVLIETAEQAEALPIGTIATLADHDGASAFILADDGIEGPGWHCEHEIKEHAYVVGWTALVLVEAEAEYSTDESESRWSFDGVYGSPENVRRDGWDGPVRERYVTEWEEM